MLKRTENRFLIDKKKSTIAVNPMTKNGIIKLLVNEQLILRESASTYTNYRDIESGGCECGAWKTSDPNLHEHWCKKYYKG